MNVGLFCPQKFEDSPNTFSRREADFFRLFYTYKDLAANNSASSTGRLPGTRDVAGALQGICKYKFQ